jgi:hypothetical protein
MMISLDDGVMEEDASGGRADIYKGSINPKPSDQSDLKQRHRLNLGGGGALT